MLNIRKLVWKIKINSKMLFRVV